jgi:hypothetical protein
MTLLTPTQIAALTAVYKIYRFKGKLQRRVIETIFKAATGQTLGPKYYAIPIVQKLLELV